MLDKRFWDHENFLTPGNQIPLIPLSPIWIEQHYSQCFWSTNFVIRSIFADLHLFCSVVDTLGCFWGSLSHSGTHLRASTQADIQCYSICELKPSRTGGYEQPWIHLSCACAGISQAPNFDFQGWAGSVVCLANTQLASADHKGCPEGALPTSSSALPPATSADEAAGCRKELDPLLPPLPHVVCHLPPCCSWWQQCLNTVKFCFKQLICPDPPQHPSPCCITSPGTASLRCGCGCWRLPVLAWVPLPMPLSSTLIKNVHNSVLVISICCLRPNYTVCSALSKAAHLLCEKQFRNLRLPSAGVLLLWSGKIRVMAGSAQHESCLRSGCRVSAAEQDGLLLCKRGWSAARPTVQPETATIPAEP